MKSNSVSVLWILLASLLMACGGDSSPDPGPTTEAGAPSYSDGGPAKDDSFKGFEGLVPPGIDGSLFPCTVDKNFISAKVYWVAILHDDDLEPDFYLQVKAINTPVFPVTPNSFVTAITPTGTKSRTANSLGLFAMEFPYQGVKVGDPVEVVVQSNPAEKAYCSKASIKLKVQVDLEKP